MATTPANRPPRATSRTTSRSGSQPALSRVVNPEVTARHRSSSTKTPRVPVVPAVVATRYLPTNRAPIRAGSATNSSTAARVTTGSVTTSSKEAISAFLSVTGSTVTSSIRSGSPW
ncbi:hypothetical protein [Kocuria sp. KH4]